MAFQILLFAFMFLLLISYILKIYKKHKCKKYKSEFDFMDDIYNNKIVKILQETKDICTVAEKIKQIDGVADCNVKKVGGLNALNIEMIANVGMFFTENRCCEINIVCGD